MAAKPKHAAPKRKPGRPTVLTPQVQERLALLVAGGANLVEACKKLRIDRQAVTKMRLAGHLAGHELHGVLARATLIGTEANLDFVEERLKRSSNGRISVDRELAHHYRWKASKLLQAYKDRADVRETLDTSKVTDEDLACWMAFEATRKVVRDARAEGAAVPQLPAPPPDPRYRDTIPSEAVRGAHPGGSRPAMRDLNPPPRSPVIEGAVSAGKDGVDRFYNHFAGSEEMGLDSAPLQPSERDAFKPGKGGTR